MSKNKKIALFIFATIVVVGLNIIKLPYYLNMPGDAYELSPIIEVDGGDAAEGKFMMTTVGVSRGKVNVLTYLWAKVAPYYELIPAERMRVHGETDQEYFYRQLHMMDTSQNVAIAVAYELANRPVEYKYNGVFVMSVIEGMDAKGKLEVGDRIFEVDNKPLLSSEEFIEYVGNLEKGDQVELSIEREGEVMKKQIIISPFPTEPTKTGVGISLVTDRDIDVQPEVKIDTNAVGGPSAGLMFTLEIYNQLTEGDLTKGYKIAGTGTMSYEGVVGPIGGIVHKIVAADKAGADYFLAPSEQGATDSNYTDAVHTANELGTDMKIIPIDTLDDAIRFLQSVEQQK
ncbi:SepM family pheromone-processing serine protease [Bacillus pinisoli]|uniref:SepM family pheromone-processing serine protease n=1 Tax=Bacillus pinisoli TaxID=2901866 RepID=UPI001FF3CC10